MNTPRSHDGPSQLTTMGHVLCSLLLIPLVALGWPALTASACEWLHTNFGYGSNVGDLITLTWNVGVGLFIGIQLSANAFRHLQGKRRSCNLWQFALVLLSAFCLLGTIFFNFFGFDAFIVAFRNNGLAQTAGDLLVLVILESSKALPCQHRDVDWRRAPLHRMLGHRVGVMLVS